MRSLSRSELSTLITCLGNFSVQYNFGSVSVALLLMSVVREVMMTKNLFCIVFDVQCSGSVHQL